MTFNTEKNKIFKMWNNSIENKFIIDNISNNNKIIFQKIESLNKTFTVYNNIITLSSDWLDPDIRIYADRDPDIPPTEKGGQGIFNMFKQFEVIFNDINPLLIPYIESKIVYRLGSSDISVPAFQDPANPNVLWDQENDFEFEYNHFIIRETAEGEFRRNLIYKTSVYLRDGTNLTLPPEIQFKFFINIINPNYYQTT